MKVAFTICSNNYLAQASILAESFKFYNPDFYFAIILMDKMSSEVNYDIIKADKIIPIDEIQEYNLQTLYFKYDIVELSTAVKPFVFKYFISIFNNLECIYYFDPDIKVYSNIDNLNNELQSSSILLTPHIFTPIPIDDFQPQESSFLNYGIYNLGFLGLNPSHQDSIKVLDWWSERTFKIGYSDVANGLFVDQLWMNFAPQFFSDVSIVDDRGCNMAPWNLHERSINEIAESVNLSNGDTLKFYHFSSYSYKLPSIFSKNYTRLPESGVELLMSLHDTYRDDLLRYNIERYIKIDYAYGRKVIKLNNPPPNVKQRIKSKLKRILFKNL